tara:strand:+ start:814 stop:1107 length:294 start_codon:yes stop_codon:yes gene_type:complete
MALEDLQSEYGPTNKRTQKGTGTILGSNITPMDNAQFGNPTIGGRKNLTTFDDLESAAHNSKYGPFNTPNTKGTGLKPDLLGNDPNLPEIDFTNYRP